MNLPCLFSKMNKLLSKNCLNFQNGSKVVFSIEINWDNIFVSYYSQTGNPVVRSADVSFMMTSYL